MNRKTIRNLALCLGLAAPLLMGADEPANGCEAVRQAPAPDISGAWAVTYDDTLEVSITLGGATYTEEIGLQGGAITIEHEGQPFTFDLDCARPEVLCPSEVWPATVTLSQPDPTFLSSVRVLLPSQTCDGQLVEAPKSRCGAGTLNPDCEDVCDGEVITKETPTVGLISEEGRRLGVFLGAGAASNGVNCLLLGISAADVDLQTIGSDAAGNWTVVEMTDGEVVTGYAGGCLWAGDPDGDAELEALVLDAAVSFKTGFSAVKAR